jgi:signal-transduction protein with cAMP-binding, CBS, and nucleotidyltransferase domain
MLAKELITDEVPPLKPSDTGRKALEWMDEFRVSHLPIVEGRQYIGIISEIDILDLNSPEEPIKNIRITLPRPFVNETKHAYEVLKLISTMDITLVPVLDEQQNYTGVITLRNLMEKIAGMPAVLEPGGIVVVDLNTNDYSLSQIAQIVEGNDAKILSAYVTSQPDSTKIELTLKINRDDLSGILQTFSRYSYTVKASFSQSEYNEDMKRRFEEFMNYLKI